MNFRQIEVASSHRVIAPRVAFLVGVRTPDDSNIIPVSNVTSVSTEPQRVGIAIYKEWLTATLIQRVTHFTISVPDFEQRELVWKLGGRYSNYELSPNRSKIEEFGEHLDLAWSSHGPVISGALARGEYRIASIDGDIGDHLWIVADTIRCEVRDDAFSQDLLPGETYKPLMQAASNLMTTSSNLIELEYF